MNLCFSILNLWLNVAASPQGSTTPRTSSSGGVRSKIGSMDNATHTPGGGNVSKLYAKTPVRVETRHLCSPRCSLLYLSVESLHLITLRPEMYTNSSHKHDFCPVRVFGCTLRPRICLWTPVLTYWE